MPHFFNKETLTEEEKINWDKAIINYNKVVDINSKLLLKSINIEEKKIIELNNLLSNNNGNEKSALFFRLLSNKKPLIMPPPNSFSYPDYDIVEKENYIELNLLNHKNDSNLICKPNKYINYEHILINQSYWKVIDIINDKKLHITYENWENYGFIWELELNEISAKESISSIISYHNPNIKKITTKEELFNEIKFQIKKRFEKIILFTNKEKYNEYEKIQIEKYKNLGEAFAKKDLKDGENLFNERLKLGLSVYPNDEEIIELTKEKMKSYLGSLYFIKNDLIYKKAWTIQRIKPKKLGEEYYINNLL